MIRKQEPSNPDNWLHNEEKDHTRLFRKLVYLGITAQEWAECTTAEKEQWEREHPEPEPIEEAEIVNE